jgi:putative nucleotidyltransferase with HDIG domain
MNPAPHITPEARATLTHCIDLKEVVQSAFTLPAMPASTVRLAALIASHNYNVEDVVEIVSFDPVLTLRIIRAANSAATGGATPATSVKEAAMRIGSAQLLSLAAATHARGIMKSELPEFGLAGGELWQHGITTALVAELLPDYCTTPIPAETFTAALLHDIGKLNLARFLNAETLAWLHRARAQGNASALEAEREILNVHHGELGGMIAQHWKLPDSIVQAIIHHHTPEEGGTTACHTVYLANLVAKSVQAILAGSSLPLDPAPSTLAHLGTTTDQLQQLCNLTSEKYTDLSARYK